MKDTNLKDIKLTSYAKTSGWAAKVGPDILDEVLSGLDNKTSINNKDSLVGIETSDDAAVYKINDELALIETLDFFTPIVDDPYTFGKIAATNSLSDVYAMGGEPTMAMNIVCFPNCLPPKILTEILKGGLEKMKEAECLLIGGHTVQDDEPKYGLSVSGFVHPNKVWKNSSARVGDILILTKPLGLGIINTAIKGGIATEEEITDAVHTMETLNKYAKRAVENYTINSCTDITGFGLMGHCYEMAKGSGTTFVLDSYNLPILKGAIDYANMGLIPKGCYDNKKFVGDNYISENDIDEALLNIMFNPETSGGLLITVPKNELDEILDKLKDIPTRFAVIGKVVEKKEKYLIVK